MNYIGEIRMFAGDFPPNGWLFCEGQLLPIAENETLFYLIGTTYGGDGQNNFALPDLRGRLPIHMGSGPGLSNRILAETGGSETVTLIEHQVPSHTHMMQGTSADADRNNPRNALPARAREALYAASGSNVTMGAPAIGAAGESQSHPNVQPFLCIHFIIALYGIYPSSI
jgi:microcystin-dependent protein